MLHGDLATRFGFELRLAYRKHFGLPVKASIWCGVCLARRAVPIDSARAEGASGTFVASRT